MGGAVSIIVQARAPTAEGAASRAIRLRKPDRSAGQTALSWSGERGGEGSWHRDGWKTGWIHALVPRIRRYVLPWGGRVAAEV